MNKEYFRFTLILSSMLLGLTDIILNGSYVSIIVWVIMAVVYRDIKGEVNK